MNQHQQIKHRVCLVIFVFGLCLAIIHGACSSFNLQQQSAMGATNKINVILLGPDNIELIQAYNDRT